MNTKLIIVFFLIEFPTFIMQKNFAQGIEITSGASIQAVGNATIEITNGNFINNGTYTMGTENLIFSGSTSGSISGSSDNDFYQLTVNNNNGITHASTGYVAVNNLLTFSLGLFNTGSNYLIINDNATYIGASTTKYINGNCRKVGNDAFIFPMGNLDKYAPITITAPSVITDHFTAAYFNTNPNPAYNISLKEAIIDHVSNLEYWTLDRTAGTSNVNVSLYWDTSSGVSNLTDLRVARWNGVLWVDEGNTGTSGDTISGNISSDLISSFSPFTFGSITTANPLPIKLMCFNATLAQKNVELAWVTKTEINNDYFTIERSDNLAYWENIKEVKGAGNSNTVLSYSIVDQNPLEGVSYYRLKQTDFNGEFSYSNIAAVNNKGIKDIVVYPNPIKDALNIKTNCENCIIKVYSAIGQLVYEGNDKEINTSNWAKGTYEVVIINNDGSLFNTKVIK